MKVELEAAPGPASRLSLVIHVVPVIFGFSDSPIIFVVLIVLLVPAIAIVLVVYLVFEVSIVARTGIARVVLLFSGIAGEAVTLVVGFLSFEPRLILRHAAYGKCERPNHRGCQNRC